VKAAAPSKKRSNVVMESYSLYIYMAMKQVHAELDISSRAMSVMDSFMDDTFHRIATEASKLATHSKRSTVSSREIQTAVRLIFPGMLAKHAVSEGTKATTHYHAHCSR